MLFAVIVISMFLFTVLIVPVLVEEIHKCVAQRRRELAMGTRHARGGHRSH